MQELGGILEWTVDYGDGPRSASVPHAWGQDVPVYHEGPVIYRASVTVPASARVLRFHGVSYAADVSINGQPTTRHRGLWSGFDVPVDAHAGRAIEIDVVVTKHGGLEFPVEEVASGFLPYVYHTFGGIYREVTWEAEEFVPSPRPEPRIAAQGGKLYLDGKPFYLRGVLHWGWYPQLGHANPDEATIRAELDAVRRLGFNAVKFCLWVPPHRYLRLLDEYGLVAWLELPLWAPHPEPEKRTAIRRELEAIVREYQSYANIIAWTIGCETGERAEPEFRREMVAFVQRATGCPLVRDVSGGAEMYGGDLQEFGTFDDFHPYADTHFFPSMLDSLLPGPRTPRPILLGETNDADVHRDLARIRKEAPYWASNDPELNAKGVRWQYDLPHVVPTTRFSTAPHENRHERLMEWSRQKSIFMRKSVVEGIRMREAIGGYVQTGLRDTPISSSGILDDWGDVRYDPSEMDPWNAEDVFFLIPYRRPAWVNGGNRPGFLDPRNHFTGRISVRVGLAVTHGRRVPIRWSLVNAHGDNVANGTVDSVAVPDLGAREVLQVHWECPEPGEFTLAVESGTVHNAWPIWVVPRLDLDGWALRDPLDLLHGVPSSASGVGVVSTRFHGEHRPDIQFLLDECTIAAPFWREAEYEFFDADFWSHLPLVGRWERWLPIATDRVIDVDALAKHWGRDYQVLMNRVDMRTYQEAPVLIRYAHGFVTTLRPFGGFGKQPYGVRNNPVGTAFLHGLMHLRYTGHAPV
ncbi:MAG: glycoside hydrolase family 2 TIM barrel-domain containing protein [Fimbriimonadaceae bacterium]|nr:glycoside hydrolase family 2 TIM barrel-domain containing protein [Fimbriimonadaceae bacterium]